MRDPLIGLRRRLDLFGIDEATTTTLVPFLPVVRREIDSILHEFWRTMRAHPEIDRLFAGQDQYRLIDKQRAHWLSVFACEWNEAYVHRAIAIGKAHARSGGRPTLYVAGYSKLRRSFLRCAVRVFGDSAALPDILCAIEKVVTMDQDIVLASHMHRFWKDSAPGPAEPEQTPEPQAATAADPVDDSIVYV